MHNQYSNFKIKLPQWIKNVGGGSVGAGAGIGFESLGFLVGVPLAGTGFWTYASACKGDKGCEGRVKTWWDKNKPNLSTGSKDNAYGDYGQEEVEEIPVIDENGHVVTYIGKKPFNYKPILYVGIGLVIATGIGYFIYKASK